MLNTVISKLKKEQEEFSHSSLMYPIDKTEFGHGQAAGYYQGLQRGLQVIEQVMNDQDEKEASK